MTQIYLLEAIKHFWKHIYSGTPTEHAGALKEAAHLQTFPSFVSREQCGFAVIMGCLICPSGVVNGLTAVTRGGTFLLAGTLQSLKGM